MARGDASGGNGEGTVADAGVWPRPGDAEGERNAGARFLFISVLSTGPPLARRPPLGRGQARWRWELVRRCSSMYCSTSSMATVFSAPRGMTMSANLLVGKM